MKRCILFILFLVEITSLSAQKAYGPIPVEATETNPIGGGKSKALLYFNCINADGKIRKPLIVFEGYDPGYYTKPNEKEGRTGRDKFLEDIKQSNSDDLKELLLDATQQYDIVYVNWVNGTDYLENNEKVAKAVINHVNYMKTIPGSTEPNVIIGRSMGSVIARMALKHMEQEYVPGNPSKPRHQTQLFISNDGGM